MILNFCLNQYLWELFSITCSLWFTSFQLFLQRTKLALSFLTPPNFCVEQELGILHYSPS